jgi:hypothetical protein
VVVVPVKRACTLSFLSSPNPARRPLPNLWTSPPKPTTALSIEHISVIGAEQVAFLKLSSELINSCRHKTYVGRTPTTHGPATYWLKDAQGIADKKSIITPEMFVFLLLMLPVRYHQTINFY